ncbi:hypothetical protein [Nocardia brasiliensis]|uniref:Uncharacterized protein n=1 Tax=Nocardia brasiliensis (strain ATCC 700358 / HUJEG-1) TaxID=1133849 RepID=K0EWB4_NOCB7|nr:hypothetical protein [Nocardia brasiliensis]AFU01374.1 hypothetical protein O3I_017065 [Nocardia brasiliensis ATCC 700358]OCF86714.1 hypothetical protein AW168_30145 [Nocardia brasiliensis]
MRSDVLTCRERRQVVRRLVALCHQMNELIDVAEAESSELLLAQAHTTCRLLQDLVLDLVAAESKIR